MHGGEGAAEGALLLLGAVLAALRDSNQWTRTILNPSSHHLTRKNTALGNNGHMLARELLLELADETLLDPVEALQETEGH